MVQFGLKGGGSLFGLAGLLCGLSGLLFGLSGLLDTGQESFAGLQVIELQVFAFQPESHAELFARQRAV
ncbi:MAG TPA: hypothetical protein VK137_16960, partial [Planctomycetaceae bacterium]|nr:hypothetical protein [Planctomycetaceae bacterium]